MKLLTSSTGLALRGLANRIAWATLIGLTYWTALFMPIADGKVPAFQRLLLYLDVPVTAMHVLVTRHLGLTVGVTGFWLDRTYCFPESPQVELFRYLRLCIPTYTLLFYAPALIRRVRHRIRSRRPNGQEPPATGA